MNLKITIAVGLCMLPLVTQAAEDGITLPQTHDIYADMVSQLDQGQTTIDYVAFRDSFIASQAYREKGIKTTEFNDLTKKMYAALGQQNVPEIMQTSKAILNIDYTNMMAHKLLSQSYTSLGDTANAKRHHDIEFGLLYSIIKHGNGHTCETAYPVVQVNEEYILINFLGVKQRVMQSLINVGGHNCDKLDMIGKDGVPVTYYFGVDKTIKAEASLLTPSQSAGS